MAESVRVMNLSQPNFDFDWLVGCPRAACSSKSVSAWNLPLVGVLVTALASVVIVCSARTLEQNSSADTQMSRCRDAQYSRRAGEVSKNIECVSVLFISREIGSRKCERGKKKTRNKKDDDIHLSDQEFGFLMCHLKVYSTVDSALVEAFGSERDKVNLGESRAFPPHQRSTAQSTLEPRAILAIGRSVHRRPP